MHVSIVHSNWQHVCLNKLSKFAGVAKSVVGLELRPCDTEAFDRNTAPIRTGHDDNCAKSDIKLASNRHMAFVIDCTEFTSDTLKTPGHMKVPRRIVAIEIRQGTSQISRKINFSI